ncbi:hypothetical protein FH972_019458 [Carpinus fangiana]|uniref:Uncharacterized protein n=1 Tax=Carpinus fangiana TaxID=176857 RepID=A0A5N6RT66_9ROSI|nr:hypothetical protein FH972_019458 [Carpinus fangiana]
MEGQSALAVNKPEVEVENRKEREEIEEKMDLKEKKGRCEEWKINRRCYYDVRC